MAKKTKRLSSAVERFKTVRSHKMKKQMTAISKSKSSTNPDRLLDNNKKEGFYRTRSTISRLNMYNEKGVLSSNDKPSGTMVRVEPDRRWFGNTRVITQSKLESFRQQMSEVSSDPYSIVLRRSKLPIHLIKENSESVSNTKYGGNLLKIEPYNQTFGEGHKRRKKPRLSSQFDSLSDLTENVEKRNTEYDIVENNENEINSRFDGFELLKDDAVLKKGTSKRIWQELYKVIDSSDIIIHVLDSRDPQGTRCIYIEQYLEKECPQKYLVYVLNKVDLIPKWVASRWIGFYASKRPTIAFHSSITNPFGKKTLFHVLRQYASLMKDKKHVSVGFIGYPNVGKSSIINTLRGSKVCKVAPIAGETKIWQYIHLTHRLYLIDCPGIVPPTSTNTENGEFNNFQASINVVLKGAVRTEKLSDPSIYISELLQKVKAHHIKQKYHLNASDNWGDTDEFLTIVGKRLGKFLKGGEIDHATTAKVILNDWITGKIPYFIPPPNKEQENNQSQGVEINKESDSKVIQVEHESLDNLKSTSDFNIEETEYFSGDEFKETDLDDESCLKEPNENSGVNISWRDIVKEFE
ncbi:hypothetical protein cand_032970 [Cryptosporidium andersoni]|uniref:Nucleolar GTP-binding protein 2 n=1 Tax=Cryptosporidium andersoni TaxID=117008 RepID=A0A1J4MBI4_9CRYT|nr:hypothetical protein cand_032970 [Cryptosporidium andersoni]